MSIKTEFAVQMTCDSCVESVKQALKQEEGVERINISLADQRVVVEGTAPPSRITRLLKETGKTVVVRGIGATNGQHVGAAVCIFDTYLPVGATQAQFLNDQSPSEQPRGLARLVQLNSDLCLLDVTVQGLTPGRHTLAIHENGDLSRGALSCGERYAPTADNESGTLGDIQVGANGWGDLVVETRRFSVHDVIGRSMVVAPATATPSGTGSLCGIIARSAGLFANMKKVCACSGRTLWEEARMQEQVHL